MALVVGAFLPWARWARPSLGTSVAVLGLENGGNVTAIVGLLLVGLALAKRGRAGCRYSLVGMSLAACALAVGIDTSWSSLALMHAVTTHSGPEISASLGIGAYLTLLGGLLSEAGAMSAVRR